ncbi:MAG: S1 RNA-binding domain-containing protein [Proteobacteria bacterium]|jgi:predicted RNA-binding protein with RPS1 domain|nr:S1 RNA-binding domain-containing protein [Pseudomonadota bacterium]
MDFIELTKRLNRSLYDSCERDALQRIGRALDQADGIAPLLEGNDASLAPFPAARLCELADAHRAFAAWKGAARELRRVLGQSGLKLPDGAMKIATTPQELGALERAARMCQRASHPDHDAWGKALDGHVELWRASVELSLRAGWIRIEVAAPDHPDADQFSSHATSKIGIAEIRGYQWLGARRGERAGILRISLILPHDEIREQSEARLPSLGLCAQKRGSDGVLEELVLGNLERAIRVQLDHRAESEALRSASLAYLGLLTAPPVKVEPLLALYVGSVSSPIGAAVIDKAGVPVATRIIPGGEDLPAAVAALVEEHKPEAAALPISAGDTDRLNTAVAALGELPVTRVHTGALKEAREELDVELPQAIGAAVVLGRRAQRPTSEFGKVAPGALGLGEYSTDLDPEKLDAVLSEARLIAGWARRVRRKGGAALAADGGGHRSQAVRTIKRLNPLVKTVRDLKPGMVVDGVVTNLTRFGAFVNIGLSTEAMIHVSQLSTEFVDEPSQVVRIGQSVTARVPEVIPEKNRIALSLKPAPVPGERSQAPRRESGQHALPPMVETTGGPRSGPSSGQSGGGEKKSRSAALADLHALFKK